MPHQLHHLRCCKTERGIRKDKRIKRLFHFLKNGTNEMELNEYNNKNQTSHL